MSRKNIVDQVSQWRFGSKDALCLFILKEGLLARKYASRAPATKAGRTKKGHNKLRVYRCERILAKASEDKDGLIVADLDLEEIKEVRTHWQFYRDRRPDMYSELAGCQR